LRFAQWTPQFVEVFQSPERKRNILEDLRGARRAGSARPRERKNQAV
jgi:hypothetical protein